MAKHQLQWRPGLPHEIVRDPSTLALDSGKLKVGLARVFDCLPSGITMAVFVPDAKDTEFNRDHSYYLTNIGNSLINGPLARDLKEVESLDPASRYSRLGRLGLHSASSISPGTARDAYRQAKSDGRDVYRGGHPIGFFQRFDKRIFGIGVVTVGTGGAENTCTSFIVK